jgi:hypothetical protein
MLGQPQARAIRCWCSTDMQHKEPLDVVGVRSGVDVMVGETMTPMRRRCMFWGGGGSLAAQK